MQFKKNTKPIHLQIVDRICDEIMSGKYPADGRLPSVREYAGKMQVNANTMMRSYEYMSQNGIIYNKRGIGFFISPESKQHIEEMRAATFYSDELQYFFYRLQKTGVTPEKLCELYNHYLNEHDNP